MIFDTKKIANLFASSGLVRFSKKCYDAMLSGFFGSMLTSYSSGQRLYEDGRLGGSEENVGSWKDSPLRRLRRRAIVGYENSRILSALSHARDWLFGCSMRFYGFFFVYFGICIILMNLIKRFAFATDMSDSLVWIIGSLPVATALPMLLSGKVFYTALRESVLFSLVLFDVLGLPKNQVKRCGEPKYGNKRYFWAAFAGALLGSLSYFVHPLWIVFGLLAFVGALIVYKNPEVGVLVTVFAAPFLSFIGAPSILLACLVLYTFACMCVKIFLGKLIFKMELSGVFVAIFAFLMLMGGFVSIGGAASVREAAIYVCFMLVYFLIVTLIKDRAWLDRLCGALVLSGALTALYGLYQKLSGNMEMGTMDKELFGDLGGRVTSTFENSNMLGVFLIMIFPFALAYVFRPVKTYVRLGALAACGIMGLCLIYTWSRGAWLGLVLACIVFVVLYSHKILPVLFPLSVLGVTLLWDKLGGSGFISSLTGRLSSIVSMSDSSSVYRLGIWRGSLKVAGENWFTGIGIGSEAFRTVYIKYAESGIETAVHSHNLFLQIFIELGIVGFVVFICTMLLCIGSGLELVRRGGRENASEKAVTVAALSGLLAALLQGMSDFIWFNYRIFFFFWVVAALLSASASIGRKKIDSRTEY